MLVDNTLILAAGFGTRMRSIGKKIPKPLWPVFEKKLIDLQIILAKKFTKKMIYINAHYLGDDLVRYIDECYKNQNIKVVVEEQILDIGGAIHNIASMGEVNYEGTLLVLNSDLFLLLDESQIHTALNDEKWSAFLWLEEAKKSDAYNKLICDENFNILGIEKFDNSSFPEKYPTYCGVSLIRLSKLEKIGGASRFFDSVANWTKRSVVGAYCSDALFIDFGTVERYANSMWSIFDGALLQDQKYNFFLENKVIETSKINNHSVSYGPGVGGRFINLTDDASIVHKEGQIRIAGDKNSQNSNTVIYFELEEKY